jgi:putative transcriptional regulator
MDKKHFENLIAGVKQMKAHMAGGTVKGIRVSEVTKPKAALIEVSKIRLSAKLTQGQFAALIGVNVRTLQNWEQDRTRPTGSAQALLKIVSYNPRVALAALHA